MGQTLQIVLAVVMFAVTFIFGFVPRMAHKKFGGHKGFDKKLSYMSCFGAGVFFATAFLDILPHLQEKKHLITLPGIAAGFPLDFFFAGVGFFLVYFIEELVLVCAGDHGHGHSHGQEPPPPLANDQKSAFLDDDQDQEHRKHSLTLADLHKRAMTASLEEIAHLADDAFSTRAITVTIAMSFHSVLEGFALGVQDTKSQIWMLFISLICHKCIEAFSVGIEISRKTQSFKKFAITIFVYSVMTPLGSILGSLLELSDINATTKYNIVFILEGLACGTFIFVTFIEILANERLSNANGLIKFVSSVLGFTTIVTLLIAFESGHETHSDVVATLTTTTIKV